MTIRPILAGVVLALASAATAQATLLTDNPTVWSALVPNAVTTAGDPAALFNSTDHVTLATG